MTEERQPAPPSHKVSRGIRVESSPCGVSLSPLITLLRRHHHLQVRSEALTTRLVKELTRVTQLESCRLNSETQTCQATWTLACSCTQGPFVIRSCSKRAIRTHFTWQVRITHAQGSPCLPLPCLVLPRPVTRPRDATLRLTKLVTLPRRIVTSEHRAAPALPSPAFSSQRVSKRHFRSDVGVCKVNRCECCSVKEGGSTPGHLKLNPNLARGSGTEQPANAPATSSRSLPIIPIIQLSSLICPRTHPGEIQRNE